MQALNALSIILDGAYAICSLTLDAPSLGAAHTSVLPARTLVQWEAKAEKYGDAPKIVALVPISGPIGSIVMIKGANFTSKNLIQFRSANASFAAGSPVASKSGASLQFEVNTCPSYEPRCPGFFVPPGVYEVTVVNENGASNEATFTLTPR